VFLWQTLIYNFVLFVVVLLLTLM